MSTSELAGSWTYRSFNPGYAAGDPTAPQLLFAEADFNFETPTRTTLQGAIEWPGRSLDVQGGGGAIAGFPSSFQITGIGAGGWEYRYQGLLTRHWENAIPALVV